VSDDPDTDDGALRVSESLDASRPGEVILLDNAGRVLTPAEKRWVDIRQWGSFVGLGVLGGGLCVLLVGSVPLGIAIGGGLVGWTLWQARHGPALKRAIALASAGKRKDARSLLEQIEARKPAAHQRTTIDYLLAKISWQEGRTDDALRRYTRAIDAYERTKRYKQEGMYWLCAFDRVQLLAVAGKLDRAVRAREALTAAPSGEYFAMEQALTDLVIAFHKRTAKGLDDDDMYEWAKKALATNRFGLALILLAWAFEKKRDEDMAAHLMEEAPGRIDPDMHLEHIAPKVHEWFEAKLAGG
jgi:hypothetical protein